MRRKEAGFYGVLALIMAGVLFLVGLPSPTATSTASLTLASAQPAGNHTSTIEVNGTQGCPSCLQLTVGVNSTRLSVGQDLGISVHLVNTLPYANDINVTAMPPAYGPNGSYRFGGFPISTWPADCLGPFPLQFIVVKGNYTVDSLPAADPDYMMGTLPCASAQGVTEFTFGAHSDQVTLTAVSCTAECSPYPGAQLPTPYRLESDFSVTGYWNATFAEMNPLNYSIYTTPAPNGGDGSSFGYPEVAPSGATAFAPGVYTLGVSSIWGQAEVVHFTVDGS